MLNKNNFFSSFNLIFTQNKMKVFGCHKTVKTKGSRHQFATTVSIVKTYMCTSMTGVCNRYMGSFFISFLFLRYSTADTAFTISPNTFFLFYLCHFLGIGLFLMQQIAYHQLVSYHNDQIHNTHECIVSDIMLFFFLFSRLTPRGER